MLAKINNPSTHDLSSPTFHQLTWEMHVLNGSPEGDGPFCIFLAGIRLLFLQAQNETKILPLWMLKSFGNFPKGTSASIWNSDMLANSLNRN